MSTRLDLYLIQAVTFHDGRISRIVRETVARSRYGAEMDAAALKLDLELLEAGCSVYINDVLAWSNYLAPGAPQNLQEACRS